MLNPNIPTTHIQFDTSELFMKHASDEFKNAMEQEREQREKAMKDANTGRLEMWVNAMKEHGIDPQNLKQVRERCTIQSPMGYLNGDKQQGSLIIDGKVVLQWTDEYKMENNGTGVVATMTTTYKRCY